MKPILITGAFGFVGTNLSTYLRARGYDLWALDVAVAAGRASAAPHAYGRVFTWEDFNTLPTAGVAAVVHLAGKAHDTRHAGDPHAYFTINAGLTGALVARLTSEPATRTIPFVLFSSVKAVADSVDGVLTEAAAPDPRTPYGQSKLEAERIVGGAPLAGTILRPCMIHGPGNKGNLNLLCKVAGRGLPWPLGAFDNRRSFAAIGNVCAAVERVLAGAVPPGTYQVADDDPLSTNELIAWIAESAGRRARVWRVPPRWVRGAARVGDALHLPLTSERLRKLTESYVVSNAKLKRVLGWERMPVAARDGMRLTLESFR